MARSHEEIYDLVGRALKEAEQANQKATEALSRAVLDPMVVQRVETKVDDLIKAIGAEGVDEHGSKVGTGVIGRLMRLESLVAKRFGIYDAWLRFAAGAVAAVSVAAGVIWWILSDRMAALFKGAP